MLKALKNNIIYATGVLALFVGVIAMSPTYAHAQYYGGGYTYSNGYSNYGSGYSYAGGYNNGTYNAVYNGGYYYPTYPSPLTIPTVQVVYANGYYNNYYVPTVTYFPAGNTIGNYSGYNGYNYGGGYNNYGNGGYNYGGGYNGGYNYGNGGYNHSVSDGHCNAAPGQLCY